MNSLKDPANRPRAAFNKKAVVAIALLSLAGVTVLSADHVKVEISAVTEADKTLTVRFPPSSVYSPTATVMVFRGPQDIDYSRVLTERTISMIASEKGVRFQLAFGEDQGKRPRLVWCSGFRLTRVRLSEGTERHVLTWVSPDSDRLVLK